MIYYAMLTQCTRQTTDRLAITCSMLWSDMCHKHLLFDHWPVEKLTQVVTNVV